jgi:hypothetical protein
MNIDITNALRDALPFDAYIFNPSIAHIVGDVYLISARVYRNKLNSPFKESPNLSRNPQHPWGSDWKGEIDVTFILPAIITKNHVQPITTGGWPLRVPVQDMRLFRFMRDGSLVSFVLTYNKNYEGQRDLVIKGGQNCADYCYIIGWSYLLVNTHTLSYHYLPGQLPLCMNISNRIDKNWSLWRYNTPDELTYLMISYELVPDHTVYSAKITGVEHTEMIADSTCRIMTSQNRQKNVLADLESFYDNQMFVSLSTPSYPTARANIYQAVGHIKIKLDYLRSNIDSSTNLGKFAKKYVNNTNTKRYLHKTYIYLMFIYQFKVTTPTTSDLRSGYKNHNIELTGSTAKRNAELTHLSPAFIINDPTGYDYMLNFPAGMVLNDKQTIISYGNGDATSNLLFFTNTQIKNMLEPVKNITPANYQFLHLDINRQGLVNF